MLPGWAHNAALAISGEKEAQGGRGVLMRELHACLAGQLERGGRAEGSIQCAQDAREALAQQHLRCVACIMLWHTSQMLPLAARPVVCCFPNAR